MLIQTTEVAGILRRTGAMKVNIIAAVAVLLMNIEKVPVMRRPSVYVGEKSEDLVVTCKNSVFKVILCIFTQNLRMLR